jgi:ubiquinone biosynthesis protein
VDVLEVVFRLAIQVPVAAVVTFLALRLLGVRRSWVAMTVAGGAAWFGGNLLVAGLSDWDWDAARLSVGTVAVMFVFAMLAVLALDFVARPGTLARGERAGLFVVPRPLRDVRNHLVPYARYRQVLGIARRNGLMARVRGGEWFQGPGFAIALRATLEECGPVFVKVGQMASTRPDLLPPAVRAELSDLRSHVAPAPRAEMERALAAELGVPVDEVFDEFDWDPIGSASIAQAYAARLRSGEPVVVKVQRPGIEEMVERDIAALLHLARAVERGTPQGHDLRIAAAAEEFAQNLRNELDFVREAANAIDLATATDPEAGVRIPHIHSELLTRRVMVQERFDGPSVGEVAPELDDEALADTIVHTVVRHMFLHGHYHADPHPGNVLLLPDGTLGLIDFGSTGRLDSRQRTALIDMTAAAMRGDGAGLLDAIEQVARVGHNARDGALERALDRFIAANVKPGQSIDIEALNDLMPLLATFDIEMPPEFGAVMRALLLLDGTARTIAPDYSLTDGLTRLVVAGIPTGGGGGSLADRVVRELAGQLPRLRRLPGQLDRIVSMTARGELRHQVALFGTETDARVVTTLVNRIVLALTGGLLFTGSALLLAVADGSALGDASLTRVLGFVGLAVAAVLLLRVVAAIVRDGYN